MNPEDALSRVRLTDEISAAIVELYAEFYDHARTTASTYINDNIVVCVLENILSSAETVQIDAGRSSSSSGSLNAIVLYRMVTSSRTITTQLSM